MTTTGLYKKLKITIEYETHDGKSGTDVLFDRETKHADIYMTSSTSRELEPVYSSRASSYGCPIDHKQVGPTTFRLNLQYGNTR